MLGLAHSDEGQVTKSESLVHMSVHQRGRLSGPVPSGALMSLPFVDGPQRGVSDAPRERHLQTWLPSLRLQNSRRDGNGVSIYI